jgi:two-component system, NtrC family, sensor kinase
MSQPLRILLIDDNPVDCALIRQVLEPEFAELRLRQVTDEAGLVGVIEDGDFDLVLCDYLLPWTDGLAILRTVKARWPTIPVLMVTGSDNEENAIQAIKSGLDDYILKSSRHLTRLPATIRSILDRIDQRHRLEEAEVRFHSLFDRIPVGLFRATPAGEFLDVNPALAEMLGYPDRESLLAVHTSALYADAEAQARWRRLAERDGIVRNYEVRLRRLDGTTIWGRATARVARGETGRVLCYEGSLEDITERKWAEDVLAERTQQLEAVRAVTTEITRELDLPALLELLTVRVVELLRGSSGEVALWDERRQLLEPQAWQGLGEWIREIRYPLGIGIAGTVAAERRGMIIEDYRQFPRAVPEYLARVEIASAMAEPLMYRDRLVGVIVVNRPPAVHPFGGQDLELLRLFAAQAAVAIVNARLFGEVARAKAEWENTFDATADLIAVLATDGTILRSNRALANRCRVTPAEIVGRRCFDIFPECDGPSESCGLTRCLQAKASVTLERTLSTTGEVFLQTYSPLLDASGAVAAVIQVSKDVTAQRRMHDQLLHSEKMAAMGRLISGVAHELNNPLTAIFGNAQLLLLGTTDEVTRQRAETLAGEAERAAKIVRNLLSFARPYKPERTQVAINPLVEATLDLRAYECEVRNIRVRTTLSPALPTVLADPHQIQQVLLNLLINAEQALHPQGGEILITTGPAEAGHLTISVEDSGPGIPAEILERIFDPFVTSKDVGQGTGLGLSICYAILQEHGGRIRAGNRPQGGAAFAFDLPVDAAALEAPPLPEVPRPAEAARRTLRILVADDERSIVRLVSGALRMEGHQVDVAQDGRTAVEKLRQADYDLVLMDMKMPGLSGERIYDEVICRKSARPQVVIMTGDTISPGTRAFLKRTGLRCLEKPFRLEQIWECARLDTP